MKTCTHGWNQKNGLHEFKKQDRHFIYPTTIIR